MCARARVCVVRALEQKLLSEILFVVPGRLDTFWCTLKEQGQRRNDERER